MSYTDKKEMTPARMWSIALVVLIHVIIGYALVKSGYEVVKKVAADLNTFDVKDEPPPPVEPPPPPPPDKNIPPPPVVSPPPIVNTNQAPPPVVTQPTPPPVFVPTPEPPRPVPPPPPLPKPQVATKAVLRGGSISDEDYPPAAVRNEESGTAVATFTIGTDGKVASCNASGASASLDAETCKLIIRRFRFKPALDASGQPIAETRTQRVTWRLPQ
jgi:periplasmic protein TonB